MHKEENKDKFGPNKFHCANCRYYDQLNSKRALCRWPDNHNIINGKPVEKDYYCLNYEGQGVVGTG